MKIKFYKNKRGDGIGKLPEVKLNNLMIPLDF